MPLNILYRRVHLPWSVAPETQTQTQTQSMHAYVQREDGFYRAGVVMVSTTQQQFWPKMAVNVDVGSNVHLRALTTLTTMAHNFLNMFQILMKLAPLESPEHQLSNGAHYI